MLETGGSSETAKDLHVARALLAGTLAFKARVLRIKRPRPAQATGTQTPRFIFE